MLNVKLGSSLDTGTIHSMSVGMLLNIIPSHSHLINHWDMRHTVHMWSVPIPFYVITAAVIEDVPSRPCN